MRRPYFQKAISSDDRGKHGWDVLYFFLHATASTHHSLSTVTGQEKTKFGRLRSNQCDKGTSRTIPVVHRGRASNLQSLAKFSDLALDLDHNAEDEEVGEC